MSISETEGIEYILCEICGNKFKMITERHVNSHNITLKDYIIRFPDAPIRCINTQKKCEATCLKNYGVRNPFQSDQIKDKIRKTNMDRFSVEYPSQSDVIKDKKIATSLRNYGVEYPSQLDSIKDKKIVTSLKRYGTEYPWQSDIIKSNIKKTLMDKYGVEYPAQSEVIRSKMKETTMDRFGVENVAQSEDIKNRIKVTTFKRYGVNYFLQLDWVNELGRSAVKKWRDLYPKEVRENSIKGGIASTLSQNGKSSSIELKIRQILLNNNYKFKIQLPLLNLCIPDIVFEDKKIIIQCDGDYWHSYPNGLNRDHYQDEILKDNGWTVIRFWEHEINNNIEDCLHKFESEYHKLSSIQLRQ